MSFDNRLQEETTALGVPCVTLCEQTERPVTITHGTNRMVPWPLTRAGMVESFRARVERLLPKGEYTRGVLTLAGSSAVGQVTTVLVSPILTRLFTPAEFGTLAVYSSLLGTMGIICLLRYDMGVLVSESREDAVNTAAAGLGALCAIVLGLALTLAFAGGAVARVLGREAVAGVLWLLPIGVAGVGTYRLLSVWELQRGEVSLVGRTALTQSLGQVGTQLTAGVLGFGAIGLVASQIVGTSAGIGKLARRILTRDGDLIRGVSASRVRAQVRRLKWFPLFSSAAALVNYATWYLPPILLATRYGVGVAGWFALAQRLLGAPTAQIGNAVANVYAATAPVRMRTDPAGALRLFDRTARALFLTGTIPVLLVALGAPYFVGRVFGANWGEAGIYLRILAWMFAIRVIADPLGQTLTVLGSPARQLVWDGVRLAGVLAVFLAGYQWTWTARDLLLAYSGVVAASYAAILFASRLALGRIASAAVPSPPPIR